VRRVATAVVCVAVVAGCGSNPATTSKRARIDAALRELRELRVPPVNAGHCDSVGCAEVEYTIGTKPPNGISAAEWPAAIRTDRELPAAARRALLGR
jgi:hypothetical protein